MEVKQGPLTPSSSTSVPPASATTPAATPRPAPLSAMQVVPIAGITPVGETSVTAVALTDDVNGGAGGRAGMMSPCLGELP
ncbi:hypothetical protein E2562_035580 [Oryza meyeriana var. granulata]|uniref:Uncharacterized protein n=1 Tax=Oryza meyeriana var. granulata TaxID=110450 RepID=A0A6G1CBB2_9ORYZ|nr:hypothetical protein E2562_035580 [Oryza meyeriana var. granulata]